MTTKDGVAERLKVARKKARLTQEECAELIGVSIMTVRRLEWGTGGIL
ncbi:MAG: helix-turn-helix transcriptional regulator [Synergistaceae bacterium]|nr:helix-turn-helix transcriptional regulator [Synergistaceae bacterium]